MTVNDLIVDELTNIHGQLLQVAQRAQTEHLQPVDEVHGVPLVDVPEDLVEVAHQLLEFRVGDVEFPRAEVVGEDVARDVLDERFEGHGHPARLVQHPLQSRHLGEHRVVQHLEHVGAGPHVHEEARHVPSGDLLLGPVAESQRCNEREIDG